MKATKPKQLLHMAITRSLILFIFVVEGNNVFHNIVIIVCSFKKNNKQASPFSNLLD